MRKIWPLFILLLIACTPVVTPTPEAIPESEPPAPVIVPNLRVYDSPWNIVAEEYVDTPRSVTTDALLSSYVEEYNATHTDGQLFLVSGTEVVPVEYAPKVNAWVVDPGNYTRLRVYEGQARANLPALLASWRAEATTLGGVLYVDRQPPEPVIVTPPTPYELYALYVIDPTGAIYCETHCEDWQENGWESQAALYNALLPSYRLEAQQHGAGWTYVAGRIYTP